MSLVSVVYVSTSRTLLSEDDIRDLLLEARIKNAARDVTGLLLYWDGNFLQYVEGPRGAIEDLMSRIRRDARHRDVTVLSEEEIAARAFPDWRMGFHRARPVESSGQDGVSNYLADGMLDGEAGGLALHVRRLIEVFRKNLR